MNETLYRVSEVFGPTIQGEGPLVGRPTCFVRLGGCDYRCDWCDSLHAVLVQHYPEWSPMTPEAILGEVERLAGGPILITVSGGNPALYRLDAFLALAHERGHRVALETQGSIPRKWFALLDHLILSPKPPSSRMRFDPGKLAECISLAGPDTQVALKVVVFDGVDFDFARQVGRLHPDLPFYLQPGNHTPPHLADHVDVDGVLERTRWLVERVGAERWYNAAVIPQLHTLLWGNRRGV